MVNVPQLWFVREFDKVVHLLEKHKNDLSKDVRLVIIDRCQHLIKILDF